MFSIEVKIDTEEIVSVIVTADTLPSTAKLTPGDALSERSRKGGQGTA